ncbi:MAG: hypothetical protein A2945_03225 [Candidatus Liptonbacteria bacterium RIFCSPLOWO2_01_FULL_52_25]|uniref:3D domain-containing protein n=1 Tax=Candidatus Liptonbacteria bacterium RIFCSPLOWO2_01_FULL_52_25 TaxID=1798650 RepID=A0A1G2CEJ7_9BACT|nr:MAG: hypothetical protein A2945_03225 [Candidatus Liptonbacteria bacterium RIFCSPLOWO2_01_FULL_52_25]
MHSTSATSVVLSMPTINLENMARKEVLQEAPSPKTHTVTLTAYSSSEDETDDTPFTTASGKRTREGIVAANFLPFGTHIQIPDLFDDRIFIVEDRMHRRKINNVDIWMSSKHEALTFGIVEAEIIIMEGPTQIAER